MERVRSGKAVHVPVPTPLAPVLLSRDERKQLRVVKHRAFQRHQQNAMWTRSVFVFDGVTHRLSNNSSGGDDDDGESAPIESRIADSTSSSNAGNDSDAHARQQQYRSSDEARLLDQIDAKAREIASTKQQIARFEHEQRENQERFEELIAGLKSIANSAALASFHERVQQERVQLLPAPARELEVVKL